MNSVPMAFIRTLARRKVRDLTVVAIVHGMPIEWLVAAGCVRSVVSGLVSLEGFGLAPRFRAAVQATRGRDRGVQRAHPDLPAPGRGLPDPVHADEGGPRHRHARAPPRDDPRANRPRDRRAATSPARRSRSTSRSSTPRPPTRAATCGSIRSSSGWTPSSSRPPRRRSSTVERIVPEASFRAEPHRTTYPRFTIDTVVEAPWGAYPTSCFPRYSYDGDFFRAYAAAHTDPAAGQAFWSERIARPRDARARSWTRTAAARTLLSIARRTT